MTLLPPCVIYYLFNRYIDVYVRVRFSKLAHVITPERRRLCGTTRGTYIGPGTT